MKSVRIKSVVFGFIIGAITASSVTAFGIAYASGQVEAWLQDKQIRLIVDNTPVTLPEDMHILNYDNRIYTPARLVAETLGATVEWDDKMQTVVITKPEPEIVEVEVEVEKIVERPSSGSNNNNNSSVRYHHSPLPIRMIKDGIRINIKEIFFHDYRTDIVFDFENDSGYPLMFTKEQIYIEHEGIKYTVMDDFEGRFDNTTPYGFDEKDMKLTFEALPIYEGEVKINLVMEWYKQIYADDPLPFVNFEFYVDAWDGDGYNFSR